MYLHTWKERMQVNERNRGPLGEPAPTVGIMKNSWHYKL
jgi:hypothetical protein